MPPAWLKAYAALYRGSLEDDRMCLCGILAAEALTVDAEVLPGLQRFFRASVDWLAARLEEGVAEGTVHLSGTAADHASVFLATRQGALVIARSTSDLAAFDRTAHRLVADLTSTG